ncbi:MULTISPECIES: pyrroline-5-carboxylate reductase [unclassified Oscillibacter]|uniref:pyrroline-5-carboxylate reductase n=1 Tax=unclassified Oscillibacter TaxID=2629304 RepID=UPI0025E57C8E|nr:MULTISPECIES: pyrroline-5-carboxylate reductase [unclassified Oscillibacter]
MATYGFIGVGNMGGALARAVCRTVEPDQVFLSNRTMAKAEALAEELGCRTADGEAVAGSADFIFLGVKPHMMKDLLADIGPVLAARETRFILVSMAAGLSIADIQELAGDTYPVIRVMPNTPCSIGEGMTLYSLSADVSAEEEQAFLADMAGAGKFLALEERLIDAGSAVSGCGPAFICLFLEALSDGGVACGLPRATAIDLASQTLVGTARLQQESGKHPGALKDAVCSPGGTTIQGVRALENGGFRAAAMNAVISAYEKTAALKQ